MKVDQNMSVLTRSMRTVNLGGRRSQRTAGLEEFIPEKHSTPKSSDLQLEKDGPQLRRRPDLLPHSPRSDVVSSSLDMEKEQERLEKLIQEEETERKWNQPRKIVDVFRDTKSTSDFLQLKDDIKTLSSRPSASPKHSPYSSPRHHAGNDFYDEGTDVDHHQEYDEGLTANYIEKEEVSQPIVASNPTYTMPDPWSKIMSFEPHDSRNSSNRQWHSLSAKSSLCSERSSRLDPHTYQSYTAGLLHSSGKSEKFLNLQKHYSVLERISELEKKRSKSLRPEKKPRSWHADITAEDEELEDLYLELDEAKKNKEFFSRKSEHAHKHWNPNADKGLMQKQKSLQDLKMKYDNDDSFEDGSDRKFYGTRSLGREKKFAALAEKFKLFDDDFHHSFDSTKSKRQQSWQGSDFYSSNTKTALASKLAVTSMQTEGQTPNKYEICVEGNLNQKGLKGLEALHVRSFSAPNTQKEVENGNPLIRTNSSKESFFGGPPVEEKVSLSVSPISVIHGRKIMATYVNENPALWNEYPEESKKEVLTKQSSTLRVFSRRGVDISPIQDVKNCVQMFENNQKHAEFHDNSNISDEATMHPVDEQKETANRNKEHNFKPVITSQNTQLGGSGVKFHVRNLRCLAENNEFSQSRFSMKPQVDRQPMMEKYLEDVLEHSRSNERLELIDSDPERFYSSETDRSEQEEVYPEPRQWGNSEVIHHHYDSSDDTESVGSDESAGTFIVKHSDEESDVNLPDVTKGTQSVRFSEADKEFPRAKSVPDLKNKEGDQIPLRPRSAKSQLNLSKNDQSKDGGTVSQVKSLRQLFQERKEMGKRNRLQFDKDVGKLKLNPSSSTSDVVDAKAVQIEDKIKDPQHEWSNSQKMFKNDNNNIPVDQGNRVKKFVLVKKPLKVAVSSKSDVRSQERIKQDMPIKKKSPIVLKRGFLQQSMPDRYYHTIAAPSRKAPTTFKEGDNAGGGTLPRSFGALPRSSGTLPRPSGGQQDQTQSMTIAGHYFIKLHFPDSPALTLQLCMSS